MAGLKSRSAYLGWPANETVPNEKEDELKVRAVL